MANDFQTAVESVLEKGGYQNVKVGLVRGLAENYVYVDMDGGGAGKKCRIAFGVEAAAGDYAITVSSARSELPVVIGTFSATPSSKTKKIDSDVFAPPSHLTAYEGIGFVMWTWSAPITGKDILYWVQINAAADEDGNEETVTLTKGSMHLEVLAPTTIRYLRVRSVAPDGQLSGWSDWVEGTAQGTALTIDSIVPLEFGGTESDLSAAGPGVVVQDVLGDPLTVRALVGADVDFTVQETDFTDRGDLVVGIDGGGFAILPRGSDGQVLGVDSSNTPTGLAWADPTDASVAAGIVEEHQISKVLWRKTLTGVGVLDTNDTPDVGSTDLSGYDHLLVRVWNLQTNVAVTFDGVHIYFNNDLTNTNYRQQQLTGSATTVTSQATDAPIIGEAPGSSGSLRYGGMMRIEIDNYAAATWHKLAMSQWTFRSQPSTQRAGVRMVHWENESAITRIMIRADGGQDLRVGSTMEVIGIKTADVVVDGLGVTDHGALTGLADDDHSQYHNDTRGDLRYILKSLLDNKGDLIAASTADTPAILPVGVDGQILSANSGESVGLEWIDLPPGMIVDTLENILGTTPDEGLTAFATTVSDVNLTRVNRFYSADGSGWFESALPMALRSSLDMGINPANGLSGYEDDYFTNKTAYNFKIGGSEVDEEGGVRLDTSATPHEAQVYLNDQWNPIPTDLTTEYGDFRHTAIAEEIYVWLGNSVAVGLNGLSLVQEYQVSMGAYPVAPPIYGGSF